jgi:hypothetical protein
MADSVYTYVHKALEVLDNKIHEIEINYAPTNLTIPGTATLNGNTTIGSDDSDILTVNATTTFNNDVNANIVNIHTLNVYDNTVIGQDNTDTLSVKSTTTFDINSSATFDGAFNVSRNAIFGTDNTNTLTSTGTITAPHFQMPITSGNSMKIGENDTIVYREYSSGGGNIYNDYPKGVIVVVKNIYSANISITINSSAGTNIQGANTTATYLKTSTTGFTLIG